MTRLYIVLSLLLTAAALVATLILYPQLPEKIPIHWNIHGVVDGYGGREWSLLTPTILVGILLLFWVIPWLSPKHFEVDSFRSTYWFIVLVMTGLFVYIHGLLMWAAWSGKVDITRPMLAGILVMFALLGNVLGKVRRNFYVGVALPGHWPANESGTTPTAWRRSCSSARGSSASPPSCSPFRCRR